MDRFQFFTRFLNKNTLTINQQRLKNKGLFADIDVSGNTLKKMIRSAQVAQYNYIMVVGQDEMKNDTLSFRKRDEEEEKRGTKIDDVIAMMAPLIITLDQRPL